jgi:predicted O-linked N-acetylglucosamine transferase (SPINDLY family)
MPESISHFHSVDLDLFEKSTFSCAEKGELKIIDLMNAADHLSVSGRKDKAIELYGQWLTYTNSPLAYVACFNLGVELSAVHDYVKAEAMYRQALELKADLVQAYLNLGNCLEQQGRDDEALEQWQTSLNYSSGDQPENKAFHLHALNNMGRLLESKRKFLESFEILERSYALDPNQRDVILHIVHLAQKMCKWPIFKFLNGLGSGLNDEIIKFTSPLAMLAATGDPALQLTAARHFVERKYIADNVPLAPVAGFQHARIRLGYLSSNFSMHAVSLLTVELFELHDKERFEIYGFCWSRDDGTVIQNRISTAMDHYIRIGSMDDKEAAECIRSHEIDILIDLQGLTSGARPLILSHRPAPVQVTYLGFPGTTALPWIDYVLADRYIIPEYELSHFTEKPLYLADCFQVSDSKREVGALPARADNNLPENGFVFCGFNNNYKITQEMFAVWMRILKKVPKSVLWLLADNEWAKANLYNAAKKQGIKKDRIIFAPRVLPADYLARYQLADLFLDTYPFNGGTTANDALFMGLPLLTLSGRTFASRYAGSLLTNLKLPELITDSFGDYEKKAVQLAKNSKLYGTLKKRLDEQRVASSTFNTLKKVRNIEELFLSAVVGSHAGTAVTSLASESFTEVTAAENRIVQKQKLVVYTVLIGDKEVLNDPLCAITDRTSTDLEIDYICFTDNTDLKSITWQMVALNFPPLPPEKLSRRPKALPHEYLSDYKFSLYIDNTIAFRRLPSSADLNSSNKPLFRAFRHPWRKSPLDEADMVVYSGYEDQTTVNAQIEYCSRVKPLGDITHLTKGTVLLREHNNPLVKRFGITWWEQILIFSKRDQLSLDFSLEVSGCPIEYFEAEFMNNDFVAWPLVADGHRIQAGFDAAKYAWKNRNIPAAVKNPQKHFLEFGKGLDKEYKKVVPWFEHICRREGSSMGNFVPPRRSIANIVETLLEKACQADAHILAVRVVADSTVAFSDTEFAAALQSIKAYYKFRESPQIKNISILEKDTESDAVYTAAFGISNYSVVLIFGVPQCSAAKLAQKFVPLLAVNTGVMLLQLCGSAPQTICSDIMSLLGKEVNLYHSAHIEHSGILPNSVLVLPNNQKPPKGVCEI